MLITGFPMHLLDYNLEDCATLEIPLLKKAFMESILLVRTEDRESKTDREDYKATKSIYMKNGFY